MKKHLERSRHKSISVLKSELGKFFGDIFIYLLYLFLSIFIILLIPVLIEGNYESILRIGEFVIVGSGTLTILTFTYALAMGGRSIYQSKGRTVLMIQMR